MARISQYNQDNDVTQNDQLVGIDSANGNTVNFTIDAIAQFFASTGIADPSRLGFGFNFGGFLAHDATIPTVQNGEFYYRIGMDRSRDYAGVTEIIVSKTTILNGDFRGAATILNRGILKVSSVASAADNNYGFYRVTEVGGIDTTDTFITISVAFNQNSGVGSLPIEQISLTPLGNVSISGAILQGMGIYSGTGNPENVVPNPPNGNFYIQFDLDADLNPFNYRVYGPSVNGTWGDSTTMQGPAGPQGPMGDMGNQGDQGVSVTGFTAQSPLVDGVDAIYDVDGFDPSTQTVTSLGTITVPAGERGAEGRQGPQGDPGPQGDQGSQGRFLVYIYIRSATAPPTPTGGTIAANGDVTTPPTGWSATVAGTTGTDPVWQSTFEFNPEEPTATPAWTQPFETGAAGPAGPPGARGRDGMPGADGAEPQSFVSGARTPGQDTEVTVTLTDGTVLAPFQVAPGAQGAASTVPGPAGEISMVSATNVPLNADGTIGTATVVNNGSATDAELAFGIPIGQTGVSITAVNDRGLDSNDNRLIDFTLSDGTTQPAMPIAIERGPTGATGAAGAAGRDGTDGTDGTGITNITAVDPVTMQVVPVPSNPIAGDYQTVTVTLSDGSTEAFNVINGQGRQGDQGFAGIFNVQVYAREINQGSAPAAPTVQWSVTNNALTGGNLGTIWFATPQTGDGPLYTSTAQLDPESFGTNETIDITWRDVAVLSINGNTPTITAASPVASLAPGSDVTVQTDPTTTGVQFTFGIPRGNDGAAGARGNTIFNGTAVPSTDATSDTFPEEPQSGDFFLRTDTEELYGPVVRTNVLLSWGTPVTIQGERGPRGNFDISIYQIGATSSGAPTVPLPNTLNWNNVGGTDMRGALEGTFGSWSLEVPGTPTATQTLYTSTSFVATMDTGVTQLTWGPAIPAGRQGPAGQDGTITRSGAVAPDGMVNGNEGDFYIQFTGPVLTPTDAVLFGPKPAGTGNGNDNWTGAARIDLVGPQGEAGTSILSGAINVGPTATEGDQGDFFIERTGNAGTGAVSAEYIYGPRTAETSSVAAAWGTRVRITAGGTILNGTGAPNGNVSAEVGDFYINTTTNQIFGPKVRPGEFDWTSDGTTPLVGTSLIGPAGANGMDGAQGAQGIFDVALFQRSVTPPAVPGMGDDQVIWNLDDNTLLEGRGWSLSIPGGTENLYRSTALGDPSGATMDTMNRRVIDLSLETPTQVDESGDPSGNTGQIMAEVTSGSSTIAGPTQVSTIDWVLSEEQRTNNVVDISGETVTVHLDEIGGGGGTSAIDVQGNGVTGATAINTINVVGENDGTDGIFVTVDETPDGTGRIRISQSAITPDMTIVARNFDTPNFSVNTPTTQTYTLTASVLTSGFANNPNPTVSVTRNGVALAANMITVGQRDANGVSTVTVAAQTSTAATTYVMTASVAGTSDSNDPLIVQFERPAPPVLTLQAQANGFMSITDMTDYTANSSGLAGTGTIEVGDDGMLTYVSATNRVDFWTQVGDITLTASPGANASGDAAINDGFWRTFLGGTTPRIAASAAGVVEFNNDSSERTNLATGEIELTAVRSLRYGTTASTSFDRDALINLGNFTGGPNTGDGATAVIEFGTNNIPIGGAGLSFDLDPTRNRIYLVTSTAAPQPTQISVAGGMISVANFFTVTEVDGWRIYIASTPAGNFAPNTNLIFR